jgi:hypothetical protein
VLYNIFILRTKRMFYTANRYDATRNTETATDVRNEWGQSREILNTTFIYLDPAVAEFAVPLLLAEEGDLDSDASTSSLPSTASLISDIVLSKLRLLVLGLVIVVPKLAWRP